MRIFNASYIAVLASLNACAGDMTFGSDTVGLSSLGDACNAATECASGGCIEGSCKAVVEPCPAGAGPVVLADNPVRLDYGNGTVLRSSSGIAVDDNYVYWATQTGEILRASKLGGAATLLVQRGWAGGMAIDGTHVYWADHDGLMRIPKDGGAAELLAAPTPTGAQPWNVALDDDSVYWTSLVFGALTDGRVQRSPKTGGASLLLASPATIPWGLAIADGEVFFGTEDGHIQAVPASGGATSTLTTYAMTPSSYAANVAVDADSVYWTEACGPECRINRVSRTGGDISVLQEAVDGPYGLAVDETSVYWTDRDAVRKSAKDGSSTVTLADGQVSLEALALDANCVYWADSNGRLISVHK